MHGHSNIKIEVNILPHFPTALPKGKESPVSI